MAINTELPISKVTFDDQEISLASSGGGTTEGGEEVIQETFAGTDLPAQYDNIYNLFLNDKILYMTVEVTTEIAYTYNRYMSTHETFDKTYSVGTIFKSVPSKKQSNGLFFSTSDGFAQGAFWLKPTGELIITSQIVYVDATSTHYYAYASANIPLSSVTIKVSHFN